MTAANLTKDQARAAVLQALLEGRKTRTELKATVPFGNYTALMGGLEADGLVKGEKKEGDKQVGYALTAKGKKATKAAATEGGAA